MGENPTLIHIKSKNDICGTNNIFIIGGLQANYADKCDQKYGGRIKDIYDGDKDMLKHYKNELKIAKLENKSPEEINKIKETVKYYELKTLKLKSKLDGLHGNAYYNTRMTNEEYDKL